MGSSYRSAGHANGEEAAGVSDEIRLEYFLLPVEGTQSTNIGSGYAEARKARDRVPCFARNLLADGSAESSAANAVSCSAGNARRNDFKRTSASRRQVVKS